MTDIAIVFTVLGAIVVLFIGNWLPVELVAIGGSLALAATGVLTVEQSLAGFGDTTIVFIAALFVVSEGIDASGVTTWGGQALIERDPEVLVVNAPAAVRRQALPLGPGARPALGILAAMVVLLATGPSHPQWPPCSRPQR